MPLPPPPSQAKPKVENTADEEFTIFELNAEIKNKLGMDGPGLAAAANDLRTATNMAHKLGLKGVAYVKETGAKTYLIIKQRAGARPQLPGTRYLRGNPKVVSFVIGHKELAANAMKTTRVLVLAYVAIHVIEEIMSDQRSMSRMLGRIGGDVAKVALSSAAGFLAASAAGILFAPAIVPVAVAFVVGAAVGLGLDKLDEKYKLTEKLVTLFEKTGGFLEQQVGAARARVQEVRDNIHRTAAQALGSLIEAGVDAAMDAAEQQLREALNNLLRRYAGPMLR